MSGPLPPQKPAVTNQPKPIPVQPVPTQPIPVKPVPDSGETKRTFFLLALIGGIAFAVLVLAAGAVGLIILMANASSGGGDDDNTDAVADAGAKSAPWESSSDRRKRNPIQPTPRQSFPQNEFKKLESFDAAMKAFNSSFQSDQERALKFFNSNSLSKAQLKLILNRTAFLLKDSHSSSVRSECFDLLLRQGDKTHTKAVVEAAKAYRMSEKDFSRWFKKHNDPKLAHTLVKLMEKSGSASGLAKSGVMVLGKKVEPIILQNINSQNSSVRRRCEEILKEWKTSESKIAAQCIRDLSDQTRDVGQALRWLKSHEPIEDLKGRATGQLTKLMETLELRKRYKYDVAKVIFKWGDEKACKLIADDGERVFSDKKEVSEFLMKFNTKDSARGLAQLIGNFRVNRNKVVEALQKFGPGAEEFVIPYINEADSRKREDARKLLKHYKTDTRKIAAQCLVDLMTDEPALRHRQSPAVEYLAKLEPQSGSDIAERLGKTLKEELQKERRSFLAEKMAFAFCNWASENEKELLQTLVDDKSYRICAAAIIRQLQIDADEGKRNLKKHYSDSSRRRELGTRIVEKGSEMEEIVHELLTTSDEGEVVDALNILKQIGTEKSLSQIEKVVKVANKYNKRRALRAAEEAVTAINGRDSGD